MLAALAAGPVCWLLLVALGVHRPAGHPSAELLLYGVLVYPLLEEIVFRGGVQVALLRYSVFNRRLLGLSGANIVTSIVFAATHLWNQPPLWAASVFLPSLVFGHLRDHFNRVVPSFVVHAFYNAGFLLLFTG